MRNTTPANPLTLDPGVTTAPLLGSTWDPVIANPPAGAVFDFLGLGFTPLHQPSPFGTMLCDPIVIEIGQPGIPFAFPFPNQVAFMGLPLCTQGGSVDASSNISLSNAIDLVLGDH